MGSPFGQVLDMKLSGISPILFILATGGSILKYLAACSFPYLPLFYNWFIHLEAEIGRQSQEEYEG